MNKKFLYGAMLVVLAVLAPPPAITSAAVAAKLPYQKGQEFVVVQGYNSPPTHIKKDVYAIDFSQDGCDAYGKLAVASAAGVVELAEENGYNGGYGTQVLIDEGNHIVARYAHMIPGTIPFAVGATVVQGQSIGAIGNTGLVAGAACATHPGTHLHFAMYYQNADGSFAAVLPEPISGYTDITEGRWYLSDNDIEQGTSATAENSSANRSADISAIVGEQTQAPTSSPSPTTTVVTVNQNIATSSVVIASSVSPVLVSTATIDLIAPTNTPTATEPSTTVVQTSVNATTVTNGGGGGGGASGSGDISSGGVTVAPASSTTVPTLTTTTLQTTSISTISFDSSTLAIDLSWQAANASVNTTTTYVIYKVDPINESNTVEIATTTATSYSYPLAANDFGGDNYFVVYILNFDGSAASSGNAGSGASTVAFASASTTAPAWFTTIQPVDTENSNGSWYDDNWYDLGTGFYGLIRSLTLEGFVDSSDYFASHLYLDEYLDPNYTQLNQTYTISDNAPFTDGLQKITIGGLDIPLQPNKYYRLRTYQDYQNRSVILAGTSATGTAMYDEYIYGTGIVRNLYNFYPYLAGVIIPNYPPLAAPNPPANATTSFDSLNSILNFSWSPATDPDTTSSLLTYEWNIATSTTAGDAAPALDPTAWQSVGKIFSASAPVAFGDTYTIGIRAIDDLGNIGQPLIIPWNFPAGYTPPIQQLDHSVGIGGTGGAQKITFAATTTVSGIAFWTSPGGGGYCCSESFVSIHEDASGTPGAVIATSDSMEFTYLAPGADREYGFPSPITLAPGAYWFSVDNGPDHFNDTNVAGSVGDSYPDGEWSTAPGQDAYFRIAE
jgi:hypothetical protein